MSGPPPKPSALRQRRNKSSTSARFETSEPARKSAPSLGPNPAGGAWDKRTKEFWQRVWDSPMADEYLDADLDGLLQLAALIDQFWKEPSPKLAAEIRLQRQCYGLTPIDRRRLQWEVSRVEGAERKRPGKAPKSEAAPSADPRAVLRAV